MSPGWVLLTLLGPPLILLVGLVLRGRGLPPAAGIALNALVPGAGLLLLDRSMLEAVAGMLVTQAVLLGVGGPQDLGLYAPVMILGALWASIYTPFNPFVRTMENLTRKSPYPVKDRAGAPEGTAASGRYGSGGRAPGPKGGKEPTDSGYAVVVRCTECGAEVEVPVLARMAHCEFCGTDHMVVGHEETLQLTIPAKVRDEASLRAAIVEHYRYRHYVKLYQRHVAPLENRADQMAANGAIVTSPEIKAAAAAAERAISARAEAYRARLEKELHVVPLDRFLAPYHHGMGTLYQALFGRSKRDMEKQLRFRVGTLEAAALATGRAELPKMGKLSYLKALQPAAVLEREARTLPLERGPEVLKKAYGNLDAKQLDRTLQVIRLGGVFTPEVRAVVWRPWWTAEVRGPGINETVLVDGGSGSVVGTPPALRDEDLVELPDEARAPGKGLRFLPMECPVCGFEFPFDRDAVVHFCINCHRAFAVRGGRKIELPYDRPAGPPPPDGHRLVPFWRFALRLRTAEGQLITDMAHLTDGIDGTFDQIGDDAPMEQEDLLIPAVRLINDRLQTVAFQRLFAFTRGLRIELEQDRFPLDEKPGPLTTSLPEPEVRRLAPLYLANAFGRRDLARVNLNQVATWLFRARLESEGRLAFLWVPNPVVEPFRPYIGRFRGRALDRAEQGSPA